MKKSRNFRVWIAAGFAAFAFTLVAVLRLTDVNEKVAAAVIMGLFALLIVWVASEQPNSSQARAVSALIKRPLAVGTGDLTSPTPPTVRGEIPALAASVEQLFGKGHPNLA